MTRPHVEARYAGQHLPPRHVQVGDPPPATAQPGPRIQPQGHITGPLPPRSVEIPPPRAEALSAKREAVRRDALIYQKYATRRARTIARAAPPRSGPSMGR